MGPRRQPRVFLLSFALVPGGSAGFLGRGVLGGPCLAVCVARVRRAPCPARSARGRRYACGVRSSSCGPVPADPASAAAALKLRASPGSVGKQGAGSQLQHAGTGTGPLCRLRGAAASRGACIAVTTGCGTSAPNSPENRGSDWGPSPCPGLAGGAPRPPSRLPFPCGARGSPAAFAFRSERLGCFSLRARALGKR